MAQREFNDSVKLEVIKSNLEKNNGSIVCEICKKRMNSIGECHFDHIFPFAKGGKSTADNCQILCSECNLKKNDKMLKDFVLEEKARAFLSGKNIDIDDNNIKDNQETEAETEAETETDAKSNTYRSKSLSKEEFDLTLDNQKSRTTQSDS